MMHCKDWEERVALHLGGDLAAKDAAGVERHLTECAGCRMFGSGVKESLALLQAVHAEDVTAGYHTAVRARVMAELTGRNVWWRRGWAAGFAAAVALMVIWLASWPVRRVERLPLKVVVVIPPATAVPALTAGQARALPHRRRGAETPRVAKIPRAPLMVRMVTDDPNVVIYWIAD